MTLFEAPALAPEGAPAEDARFAAQHALAAELDRRLASLSTLEERVEAIRAAIVGYKINELKTVGIPVRPFITWFLSLVYGITLAWLERKLSPKTS